MDLLVLQTKSDYSHQFLSYGLTELSNVETPCCAGWLLGTSGCEYMKEVEQVLQTVTGARTKARFENITSISAQAPTVRAIHLYTTKEKLWSTQKELKKPFNPFLGKNQRYPYG